MGKSQNRSNKNRGSRRNSHADAWFKSEQGEVIKRQKGLIKVGLVYPNTYQTGMSSLGFQSVYGLFNDDTSVSCHRFFLPDRADIKRRADINRLVTETTPKGGERTYIDVAVFGELTSCETELPLSSCDIVAFSVSFENDYINIISILRNSAIPPRSSDRTSSYPLIIAGGVACFLNPEPIAPFIDCFLLGEAEEMIPAFLAIYSSDTPRDLLKIELAIKLKGGYVPALYEPSYDMSGDFSGMTPLHGNIPTRVKVQHISNLNTITTTTRVLARDTAFNNTFLIETGRGCHHGCRFCSAGFIYRPSRFYPDNVIISAMNGAKKLTSKIGLVSAAVSDHPGINQICAVGIADNMQISFSSLRLDSLTDQTIETLVRSSVKTATIAPEAGSQRMRNIINKKISESQILFAVERLVSHGIMNLKLYFMVGLPFEEDYDVRQIVTLTEKIMDTFLEVSRKNGKIGTITLSINPFIPKPTTPFQWCAMDTPLAFRKKVAIIRDGLKKIPNLTINTESSKTATINAILSRGDRRISSVIEAASEQGWAVALKQGNSSTETEPGNLLKKSGESLKELKNIIYRNISPDAPLPWDIIDTGIKKEFLIKELEKAQDEKVSPDCPMVECSKCGICREYTL